MSSVSRSASSEPSLFGSQTASGSAAAATQSSAGAPPNVAGDPIVNSQEPIFQCIPASYNFTGGVPPYNDIFIIESGTSDADILKTLPGAMTPGEASWGVDIQPGTSITIVVKDSRNITGYSAPIVIQTSDDSSCLAQSDATPVGTIAGAVVGSVVGLALLSLAVWFFYIKPGRTQKSTLGGTEAFYAEEGKNTSNSDVPLQIQAGTSAGATALARRPTGTFNLAEVNFRPESLDAQLVQEQNTLPTYSEAFNNRQRPPGERREVEGTQ